MKETKFIEQNKEKWLKYEKLTKLDVNDPDRLSQLFVQITDDLSYSRTFYPNRYISLYLNFLAQQLFYKIYKNRRSKVNQFINFWKEELPYVVFQCRRELLISLAVFLFAVAIGVVSSIFDPNFARTILGDSYVRMTESFIESGDPMAVYKSSYEIDMFLRITLNNLRVAFLTFVLGIFFSIGAVAILLINGIMVGTFQYFFIERGLFWESFSTIWLHGTLEISCIIIAGGAGIVLGKGLVFPGTYSRLTAFRLSARRGLKLILGISPIIVFAALIESFITRYNDAPDMLKLGVILFSAFVILSYFVWYPYLKYKSGFKYSDTEQRLFNRNKKQIAFEGKIKTINDLFGDTLFLFSQVFKKYFRFMLLVIAIYAPLTFFLIQEDLFEFMNRDNIFLGRLLTYLNYPSYNFMYIFNTLATTLSVIFIIRVLAKKAGHPVYNHPGHWAQVLVLMGAFQLLFFAPLFFLFMGLFLLPPFLFMQAYISYVERVNIIKAFSRLSKIVKSNYLNFFGLYLLLLFLGSAFIAFVGSPYVIILDVYRSFIRWNLPDGWISYEQLIVSVDIILFITGILILMPIFTIAFALQYYSFKEINEAQALKKEVNRIE